MINWTDFLSAEKRLILQQPKNVNEPTYVGIDFGTSTTVVSIAYLDDSNNLIVDRLDLKQKKVNGSSITDYRVNSAVAFINKKILIGAGAKEVRARLKRNITYWESFKMQLGNNVGATYPESEFEHFKNATDVTTFFFKALKSYIDSYVTEKGLNKNIKYAVTIPASFESHHRRDLVQCLNDANIKMDENALIDEPNAAFLSYTLFPNQKSNPLFISKDFNPNVLVFDFGAGTCDISIIEIGENTKGLYTKNISLSQFAEIGGDNFDKLIAEKILLPQLFSQSNIKKEDLRKKEIEFEILPHLKELGERLKIQVSEKISVYHEIIDLPENELINQKFHIATTKRIDSRKGELIIENPTINLKQFIELSESFQFSTDFKDLNLQVNPVFSAMEKAKLTKNDIDFVLFIGGSTKNFIIRNQVKSAFEKATPLEPNDPQSQVSMGAAIHCLLLNKFNTHVIRPITNQSIYTKISISNKEHTVTLVSAGEPVPFPTKEFSDFKPNRNGQKEIEIPFFTGSDEIELEKIVIKSPTNKGFDAKDKIQLTIDVNANKVLIIKATVNSIEAKLEIENPFISSGKTIISKATKQALIDFNIESSKNNGRPSFATYKKLVESYEKDGEYLAAAELLEEAVERYNRVDEYNQLNLLFRYAGNTNKSIGYAIKAVENNPEDSVVLFNLAAKLRYSDSVKALELMRKAIKISPESPTNNYLLGTLVKGKEQIELKRKAFNIWQAMLISDNMNSWDYSWFASCAADLGEHEMKKEIISKEQEFSNKENRFYNPDNLMGHVTNND
jgi:molecular chaperone DnaK